LTYFHTNSARRHHLRFFKLSDVSNRNFSPDIEISSLTQAAEMSLKNAKRSLLAESKTQQSLESSENDLFSDFSSKAQEKKEKFSKKQKSRPVEVDVKLGFKTMSVQEEKYEPFYKIDSTKKK